MPVGIAESHIQQIDRLLGATLQDIMPVAIAAGCSATSATSPESKSPESSKPTEDAKSSEATTDASSTYRAAKTRDSEPEPLASASPPTPPPSYAVTSASAASTESLARKDKPNGSTTGSPASAFSLRFFGAAKFNIVANLGSPQIPANFFVSSSQAV